MRIALDAMGGDLAPAAMVEGALRALDAQADVEVVLVGRRDDIERELAALGASNGRVTIHHAETVIGMDESPVAGLQQKRDSSIAQAVKLVAAGQCEAVISAGNTGATVAAGTIVLRKLPGVLRAGIAVRFMAEEHGPCVVIDVGANLQCKPEHLVQYAAMACVYAQHVVGIKSPTVGLLNVGEEDAKGNSLVKSAHQLLSDTGLNFIGNVEGSAIFLEPCSVVVCEGFAGNVLLKMGEGVAEAIISTIEDALTSAGVSNQDVLDTVKKLRRDNDYGAYGGAPLLGVDGICIIAHGRSDARTVQSAIRAACDFSRFKVNDKIVEEVARV